MFLLLLLLFETDTIIGKQNNKKNVTKIFNFDYDKIVFILLIKIVTFYLEFIIIYIWKLCF